LILNSTTVMGLSRFASTCFLIAVLLASPSESGAQAVVPPGRARVVGIVLDSATGRPVVRAHICGEVLPNSPTGPATRCASPDSSGRYVLDSLPVGSQGLTVTCSGRRLLEGTALARDTLAVADGQEVRFDVRTDAAGCDMRPFIVRRGVFLGHYTVGFEESSFLACGDSLAAWVEATPAAMRTGPQWPKPNNRYYPTYFVRWQGTLRGPWRYGHMGVSNYELTVDSILSVRRPGRSDCR